MSTIASEVVNVKVGRGRPAELLKDGRKKSDAVKEAKGVVAAASKNLRVANRGIDTADALVTRAQAALDKLVAKNEDKEAIKAAKQALKDRTAELRAAEKNATAAAKEVDKANAAFEKVQSAPTVRSNA